jgi:hypothetical protein
MEENAAVFPVAPVADGIPLREALAAHFAIEKARAARELCVRLLAVVGGLLWIVAAWPGSASGELRVGALAAYVPFLAGWGVAGLAELRLRRRLAARRASGDGVRCPSRAPGAS